MQLNRLAYPKDDDYKDHSNPPLDHIAGDPHPYDKKWVLKQIRALPYSMHNKAITGYQAAYIAAHDAEPIDHKKSNAARSAANTRLREFVKKCKECS